MRGLSIQQRIARLLEWGVVDRCILVAVIALPAVTWYELIARFVVSRPETFPWVDVAAVQLAANILLGLVASWIVVIAIGAALRKRRPDSRWIAERYEATVDKFVGDAIMVFFGAPVATHDRDHALRAVRMAIEMQARLAELRAKWTREGIEEPFEVRIGINTGVASVGNFGSKGRVDYTAIGRQVNLAARLQVNCDPGKILLSHSTWSLVQDNIACVPKGEIQVKGFHQLVKVYEVVA